MSRGRMTSRGSRYTGNGLLSGLVSHWKFDTASIGADAHGSNTLTNSGASIGTGKLNECAVLASSDNLTKTNTSFKAHTGAFTIAFWMYYEGSGSLISITHDDAVNFPFTVNDSPHGTLYGSIEGSGSEYPEASVSGLADATWNFVVFKYDPSSLIISLQVNNGTATTAAAPAANAAASGAGNALLILNLEANATRIDSMSFWTEVKTAAQMTALYNSGSGLDYASFT